MSRPLAEVPGVPQVPNSVASRERRSVPAGDTGAAGEEACSWVPVAFISILLRSRFVARLSISTTVDVAWAQQAVGGFSIRPPATASGRGCRPARYQTVPAATRHVHVSLAVFHDRRSPDECQRLWRPGLRAVRRLLLLEQHQQPRRQRHDAGVPRPRAPQGRRRPDAVQLQQENRRDEESRSDVLGRQPVQLEPPAKAGTSARASRTRST